MLTKTNEMSKKVVRFILKFLTILVIAFATLVMPFLLHYKGG